MTNADTATAFHPAPAAEEEDTRHFEKRQKLEHEDPSAAPPLPNGGCGDNPRYHYDMYMRRSHHPQYGSNNGSDEHGQPYREQPPSMPYPRGPPQGKN